MIRETLRHARAVGLLKLYYEQLRWHSAAWTVKPADIATGRAILDADPETQIEVMHIALRDGPQQPHWSLSQTLLSYLAKRALPYTADDLRAMLEAIHVAEHWHYPPPQSLLRGFARPLADPATLAACRPELERLRAMAAAKWFESASKRKFLRLLDGILAGQQERLATSITADEWGEQVRPLLDEMEPETRERWEALLAHCATGSGGVPSGKWLATARLLRKAVGTATFARLAAEWIGALRKSGNKAPEYDHQTFQRIDQGCLLDEENADLLRGLAWCCGEVEDAALAAALADAAIAGYRKITTVGPRSAKVAGACVYALKSMSGLHGAAQLERMRLGVKQPTYVRGIEKALAEAARRAGMTREDLEELTVPTFDLVNGRRRIAFGQVVAELEVAGLDVVVCWYDATGKQRKAEPAETKRDHKAELKDLKRLRDDVTRMLTAQRDRLERLPLAERAWPLAVWRERYPEHPLIGDLSRRLIWRFVAGERVMDGIWRDGGAVDAADRRLELPDTATVTAWHPAVCAASEVLAWRDWLERHQVTQPFKQAHREVYLLTEAERRTRVYSNRFAAHILRQHQFNALCAARGWRNKLRLMVDDSYPPATLELPHWGVRAEFWVEGAGDDYGTDTNETGTYLYVATDQVRFYPMGAAENYAHAGSGAYAAGYDWQTRQPTHNEPILLEEIPPLVFSEIMRDVDLFVGVASVGNDPTWQDGGPRGRYRDYWHSYSFGELSATAETRKTLLERLLPRLTIGERCAVAGRFLRVRGELRTYKIHLGSGNILMEPNDQYLCIVPGRALGTSTTDQLFLPFEGDAVLAIILSKAFLLAEDTKITDPTITHQIGRS